MIDRSIHDALLSDAWLEGSPGAAAIGRNVDRMLDAVRRHLDMDVAFVSEFNGRDRVFRHVACRLDPAPIRPGDSSPLEEGYCMRVVEGQIPQLIPDTGAIPVLHDIPETRTLPIGAHISVPILLRDGRVYGTFCCFSLASNLSLGQRDLHMMRAFADLLAYQIDGDLDAMKAHEEKVARVTAVLELGQPHIVYQPIFRSSERRIVGVECLSRFRLEPQRTPDVWFAEAREIGLGVRLELNAILTALDGLRGIAGDFHVGLNVSPQTLISGGYAAVAHDELAQREAAALPPFAHLALLRAEAKQADAPDAFLHAARNALAPFAESITVAGPMPAPMPRRAGMHRAQLLLQADARRALHAALDAVVPTLHALPEARRVRWSLDVDPIDLY